MEEEEAEEEGEKEKGVGTGVGGGDARCYQPERCRNSHPTSAISVK